MSNDSNLTPEEEQNAAETAPWETPPTGQPSWLPTRKWLAALTGAIASIIASWIVTGAFDDVERGMAATALVSLAAAYWRENAPTVGGVPEV